MAITVTLWLTRNGQPIYYILEWAKAAENEDSIEELFLAPIKHLILTIILPTKVYWCRFTMILMMQLQ